MAEKFSESVALLGRISPISQGAGTVTTGWCNLGLYKKGAGILKVGVLGASATVDAKLQQAQDSSGTGAKDITGTSITQLTKAASDDSKEVIINIDAAQLDVSGGFAYVRGSVTVGTAASLIDFTLLGIEPRYGPASDNDAATVDEIVN